jgi:hypothetical protein
MIIKRFSSNRSRDKPEITHWLFNPIKPSVIAWLIFGIAVSGSLTLVTYAARVDKMRLAVLINRDPIQEGSYLPEGAADIGPLTGMSKREKLKQFQEAVDADYFAFKINARPVFETGDGPGSLRIENPSYNIYPMVVQIFLGDTEEKIYDSGGILPNQHIDSAKLTKVLPPGSYKATAYMNAYNPDTHIWLGKQAAAIVITIKG